MRVSSGIFTANIHIKEVSFYIISTIVLGLITTIGILIFTRFSTGTFTLSVDSQPINMRNIEIADNVSFEPASKRLSAESPVDAIGMTYDLIDFEGITLSNGQYIDPDHKYLAYSFYIKNNGQETIDMVFYMRFISMTNWMGEYVRILIIEEDSIYKLYQKEDRPHEDSDMSENSQLPIGIVFMSESMIFRETIFEVTPGEIKLYRVIIWLEEQDPDRDDSYYFGSIEMMLNFTILYDYLASNQTTMLSSDINELWVPVENICSVELAIHYEKED